LDNEYIKDIVFQQDPDRIIWVLTESGKLFGLTFDKGQEVIAWHKHDIGGKIESICVIPGNKSSDILFLNVTRNGKSSIEVLRKGKALGRVNDNTLETYYIDSWKSEAYTRTGGSTGITITGVNRLANQTVTVIRAVEGTLLITVIGNYPVSAQGTINIPEYAHYANQSVIVGVPYSCKLTTVPLELNNPGNATVGSKVQLISANFKLSRTQKDLHYLAGDTWSRYDFNLGTELHISRWTGDLKLLGSVTEDTVISVGSAEPYAMGISAISIVFKISESRK
jgi:hypothetical protein